MILRLFHYFSILPASFLFLCLFGSGTYAQSIMGARSMAMGQTGVAIAGDNWSIFSNVALMETEQNQVSFYGFRYLGISEITDMAVSLNYQTNSGTIGAGIHRYGFNLFNENRMRVAYKNNLGKFHYGTAINYTHVFQGEDYGSAGAFGVDLGMGAQIAHPLWVGARATNLNQPGYGSSEEELPREMAIGFSYQLVSRALFASELVKDVRFPMSYRAGVEFEIIEFLFARAGITTEPETYSFGFGYSADHWHINIAMQQHIPLGLSPALDLSIRF